MDPVRLELPDEIIEVLHLHRAELADKHRNLLRLAEPGIGPHKLIDNAFLRSEVCRTGPGSIMDAVVVMEFVYDVGPTSGASQGQT